MRTLWRTLLYCGVAGINIFSTLLPIWPWRYSAIRYSGLPIAVILGAQHATLLLGVTMLLLAYPAAQGHRRAAYALMACAGLAVFTNFAKGLDFEEALANAALVVALWRARGRFHSLPLRYTVIDVARLAVVIVVIVRVYTLIGRSLLAWLHGIFESEHGAVPILHESFWERVQFVLTAKLALENLWFHESQYLLPMFLVGVFVLFSWTSLMRPQQSESDVADPYGRFGRNSHNSLAYLARRSDVSTFVDPVGRGAISYKQVGHVALQIGAVLAPAEAREAVYLGFCSFCTSHGLVPAAVALSQEERPLARKAGLKTVQIGTEAVVDLREFAVERLNKKMRWVQRSLAKRGYTCELVSARAITPRQRAALGRIDAEWREQRGGQLHGCCMTLGRVPTPNDPDCLLGFMYDPEGAPIAFLTLLPGGDGYYSLDLTRRLRAAPNATMEFLLMEVLTRLKERDATSVSLNFSTFSGLAATRVGAKALRLCGVAFQLQSLETFNNKFRPVWVPRYAVFPSWYAFPDVAYAIISVEGINRMVVNSLRRGIRRMLLPAPAPQIETAGQGEGL